MEMSINFIIKAKDSEEMRSCFCNLYNNIVDFYSKNGKLEVEKKIIDKIKELGSFGKSEYSRRISAYLSACTIIVLFLFNTVLR